MAGQYVVFGLFLFSHAVLGGHQTDLNRTLPLIRTWAKCENGCPKSEAPRFLYIMGPKNCLFSCGSVTTSRLKREYLQNKTNCKQRENIVKIYNWFSTFPNNLANFGSQKAEICWLLFSHPRFVGYLHGCH